jgi:hypothetical protein
MLHLLVQFGQGLSAASNRRPARFIFRLLLAFEISLYSSPKQLRHWRSRLERQFLESFDEFLRQPNSSAFLHAANIVSMSMYVK